MSEYFNESEADKIIIRSLTNELGRQRENDMSKIIKTVDGKFYLVHHFEVLAPEEVATALAEAKEKVSEIEAIAPAEGTVEEQLAAAGPDASVNQTAPTNDEPVADVATAEVTNDQPQADVPAEQPPAETADQGVASSEADSNQAEPAAPEAPAPAVAEPAITMQ